jgi:hypothetical protein
MKEPKRVTVNLEQHEMKFLTEEAAAKNISVSAALRLIIEDFMSQAQQRATFNKGFKA